MGSTARHPAPAIPISPPPVTAVTASTAAGAQALRTSQQIATVPTGSMMKTALQYLIIAPPTATPVTVSIPPATAPSVTAPPIITPAAGGYGAMGRAVLPPAKQTIISVTAFMLPMGRTLWAAMRVATAVTGSMPGATPPFSAAPLPIMVMAGCSAPAQVISAVVSPQGIRAATGSTAAARGLFSAVRPAVTAPREFPPETVHPPWTGATLPIMAVPGSVSAGAGHLTA